MKLIFRNDITPFEYREQLEQLGEILGGIDLIGYNPAAHEVFEFEVNFCSNSYPWFDKNFSILITSNAGDFTRKKITNFNKWVTLQLENLWLKIET